MALPDIDFKGIREHAGSRDRGFEELCCQLAALQPQNGGEFFRKGPGADAGVECFVRHPDGREKGWQVKYYWKMDGSLTATLPAPWLIAALGLHLSDSRRATYVDDHNDIIFVDPSLSQQGPRAGLVAREPFLAALEREGLAAVWVIAGEKNVYGESHAFGGRLSFTSLYWLKNGRWQNSTTSEFHAPTPEQVSPLFAGKVPPWVKVRAARAPARHH